MRKVCPILNLLNIVHRKSALSSFNTQCFLSLSKLLFSCTVRFCMETDELPAAVFVLTRQMNKACGELVVSRGQGCRINYLTAWFLPLR